MRPLPSNNSGRRARQALPHPDPKADRFADQLQRRAESEGLGNSLQPEKSAAFARRRAVGINSILARAESVDKAPSFRQAFAKRRCLIPADGFYEWRKTARPKLPFAIAMKDGRPFTFAGLWENWKDPESGEWLRTCTIMGLLSQPQRALGCRRNAFRCGADAS